MASNYEANKRWRLKNPKARAAQTKRNYDGGRPATAQRRRPWIEEEESAIIQVARPDDRDLARLLNRSVKSIQVRRSKLLKTSRYAKTHTPGD